MALAITNYVVKGNKITLNWDASRLAGQGYTILIKLKIYYANNSGTICSHDALNFVKLTELDIGSDTTTTVFNGSWYRNYTYNAPTDDKYRVLKFVISECEVQSGWLEEDECIVYYQNYMPSGNVKISVKDNGIDYNISGIFSGTMFGYNSYNSKISITGYKTSLDNQTWSDWKSLNRNFSLPQTITAANNIQLFDSVSIEPLLEEHTQSGITQYIQFRIALTHGVVDGYGTDTSVPVTFVSNVVARMPRMPEDEEDFLFDSNVFVFKSGQPVSCNIYHFVNGISNNMSITINRN